MRTEIISPNIGRGVQQRRKQRTLLDRALRDAAQQVAEEKAVVVVHCTIPASMAEGPFYIQRSTYLTDRHSAYRSVLIHAEGMTMAPDLTYGRNGTPLHFALYFEALPAHCAVFDLVEMTGDSFPFNAAGLVRNRMDVYRVELFE